MTKHTDVMIDLETLGVAPGCIILSIAAVPFDVGYELEPFYETISMESCAEYGLHTNPITVAWWEKQESSVRAEAFSGTRDLKLVLGSFSYWLSQLPEKPVLWGNGCDFDNPILAAAYDAVDMRRPWSYKDNCCFRTVRAMFSMIPYIPPLQVHNALHDATAQAAHMERIYQWLYQKGVRANAA